jgi:hypothetical protein
MQQIDITISPSTLTNDELLRLADYYLTQGALPKNWQYELASRFREVLDALDDLTEKK